jgi:hypothetical protein
VWWRSTRSLGWARPPSLTPCPAWVGARTERAPACAWLAALGSTGRCAILPALPGRDGRPVVACLVFELVILLPPPPAPARRPLPQCGHAPRSGENRWDHEPDPRRCCHHGQQSSPRGPGAARCGADLTLAQGTPLPHSHPLIVAQRWINDLIGVSNPAGEDLGPVTVAGQNVLRQSAIEAAAALIRYILMRQQDVARHTLGNRPGWLTQAAHMAPGPNGVGDMDDSHELSVSLLTVGDPRTATGGYLYWMFTGRCRTTRCGRTAIRPGRRSRPTVLVASPSL